MSICWKHHLLLQSILLLLVHFNHDFIFLLEDLELVFKVALLAFHGCNRMFKLLVLLYCKTRYLI